MRQGSTQPVVGARVMLTRRGGPGQPPGLAQPAPAGARGATPAPIAPLTTDDRGKFVFQGLDEGTYILQVQANGYVNQSYGQRFPNGPGAPIPLANGQAMKDANVSLQPAANISGRIRDTSEQPLINVPVQLLRYSYDATGQRRYQPVGATLTNDRGEYRMYWVTPGRYYLLAGQAASGNPLESMMLMSLGGTQPNGNEVPAVKSFAFYPGVTEIGSARPIVLEPGADLQAVDLALTAKPRTYSIRGKLIDARTGQPPTRASVSAISQMPGFSATDQMIMMGPGASTRNYTPATGTFEVRDLLPGIYTVKATLQDLPAGGRGMPTQSAGTLPVSIGSSDVEGVTISVVPAAAIPGRLRVEGQLPQGMTIDRMRLRLVPLGNNSSPLGTGADFATVAADGTFRLNNVTPGEYRVEAPIGNTAFLKEVRFEGADALNTPLRFSGSTTSGLEVVIAAGGGRITGVVTDARSERVAATRVVLIPDRARYRTDLHKYATTDANGQFTLNGVPPGDYKAFAWESIEEFGWFDPDVVSRSETRGRAVHVTETSSETLDLRMIPGEGGR
jgi:hypothetical protein